MIRGVPTNYGIEVLNTELKREVQSYALIGLPTPKEPSLESLITKEDLSFSEIEKYIFLRRTIDVGYFDESGILTYEINLRNVATDKYMYALILLDTKDKVIAALPTPQVILIDGIGGLMTIKLPIKGAVNEVVFVSSEYVSRDEFNVLKETLKPPKINLNELAIEVAPLVQERKNALDYAHRVVDYLLSTLRILLIHKQAQKSNYETINSLNAQLQSTAKGIQTKLDSEISARAQKDSELQNTLNQKAQALEDKSSQLATKDRELQSLIASTKSELSSAKNELSESIKTTNTSLQRSIADVRTHLTSSTSSTNATITALQNEIQSLKSKLTELQSKITSLESTTASRRYVYGEIRYILADQPTPEGFFGDSAMPSIPKQKYPDLYNRFKRRNDWFGEVAWLPSPPTTQYKTIIYTKKS